MLSRCLCIVLLAAIPLAAACGPSELPAFANPPPEDASVDDDAGDDG